MKVPSARFSWCVLLLLAACSGEAGAPLPEGTGGSGGSGTTGSGAGGGTSPTTGAGGMTSTTGSGGMTTTGGTGSGGSAGTASNGGNAGGGSAGTGSTPTVTTCPSPQGSTTLNETIVVGAGQTYDGMCKRFVADPDDLGDGTQEEGQKPMFELENGATLINVVLGEPAADGIHALGNATLKNITWEDVGEDALTLAGSGTVVLDGGSAAHSDDKIVQINAPSTFRVSNFKASDAGKFIRQNGDTTFKVDVFIDKCDISNMAESIFRTDSSSSTVSMTNSRYSDIGEELFMGVSDSNISESNNQEY